MKLHVLGTGNGGAIECYNTCFTLEDNGKYFLVDGGGGNRILKQLQLANIKIIDIKDIFISHIHTDHILGLIWIVRSICAKMRFEEQYEGNLNIYGNDVSINALKQLIDMLFPPARQFLDKRVFFNIVSDNEEKNILGHTFKFFDVKARKDKQFGFILDNRIAFCGDEPLSEELFDLCKDKEWLLHDAFCLESEEEIFKAHYKGHCTVKEASQIAQKLNVKNLILWHTEDNNLKNRKTDYIKEAKQYFVNNTFVPDDLEIIEL